MAQACVDAKLEGFPTWIIDGQVYSQSKMSFTLSQRINFLKKLLTCFVFIKLCLTPRMAALPARLPLTFEWVYNFPVIMQDKKDTSSVCLLVFQRERDRD